MLSADRAELERASEQPHTSGRHSYQLLFPSSTLVLRQRIIQVMRELTLLHLLSEKRKANEPNKNVSLAKQKAFVGHVFRSSFSFNSYLSLF